MNNKEKNRLYQKKYRIDNRDRLREKTKEWYLKNPRKEKDLKKIDEYIKSLREED